MASSACGSPKLSWAGVGNQRPFNPTYHARNRSACRLIQQLLTAGHPTLTSFFTKWCPTRRGVRHAASLSPVTETTQYWHALLIAFMRTATFVSANLVASPPPAALLSLAALPGPVPNRSRRSNYATLHLRAVRSTRLITSTLFA